MSDTQKMGEKIISGKIVSLDSEKIDKLEEISQDLKDEEGKIKNKIDNIIK